MTPPDTNRPDNQPDWLRKLLEELDDNLANAPGATTVKGWETWAEEKQEYYAKAAAAITTKIAEERLDEAKLIKTALLVSLKYGSEFIDVRIAELGAGLGGTDV